jgi:urease accessory protein
MIVVTAVAGNIHSSKRVAYRWRRAESTGDIERLFIVRTDMEKVRMRRKTDKGTDIGLVLDRGSRLRHGDVLDIGGKLVLIEQLSEKVATVKVGKGQLVDTSILVGHAIGNRHRPISVEKGKISFPIQNESEMEVFRKVMPEGVELKVTTQIFVPSGEAHHHE